MRWITLAALALLLAGCGDPLKTGYGDDDGQSINGLRVLTATWTEAFGARSEYRLGPRLERCALLMHAQRQGEIPGERESAWIRNWLEAEDGRQFVLVLRDGNITKWLCSRWAAEARAEAAKAEDPLAQKLTDLADELERRGGQDSEKPLVEPGKTGGCALFNVIGSTAQPAAKVHGLLDGEAPATMATSSDLTAKDVPTLIEVENADGSRRAWAISREIGGGRLVVIANATPLLDAALVDKRARQLLDALTTDIRTWRDGHGGGEAAWVTRLAVREHEAKPPNIVAMLFGTPPFSWISLHFLGLALAVLAYKAGWLGRISAPRNDAGERFTRHVDALAWHLRQSNALETCATALAQNAGRELDRPPSNLEDAREMAEQLHRPQTAAYRRRDRSPRTKDPR
jgi:hypothetical protein